MTFVELITIGWTLLVALLLFGVTVFVHELGHFLAARRMGLVVEKFAIGFGPTIYSFKRDGVEYAIKALPLGGFVALPQMAPMEMVEGETANKREDLPVVSPWAKIVTAFWGPAASFLFAVFLAVIVWKVGTPDYEEMQTTQIGYVEPDGPASKAGLQAGDDIKSINGYPVDRWFGTPQAVVQNVVLSEGEQIDFKVQRADGSFKNILVTPERNAKMENLRTVGIEPKGPVMVDSTLLKSPASRAGLRKGDLILSVDGQRIWGISQFNVAIQKSTAPVSIELKRGDGNLTLVATPEIPKGAEKRMIGVALTRGLPVTVYLSPWEQISNASTLIYRTLQAVLSPKSDVGVQHFSGPIGIFSTIMKILRYEPAQLLAFCVMFNVNLALLNMMPIPILDGGHILFSLIEWIRRRPVSIKVMSAVQTVAIVLMIGLFLFISYQDGRRVIKGNSSPKEGKTEELQFADPSPEPKN